MHDERGMDETETWMETMWMKEKTEWKGEVCMNMDGRDLDEIKRKITEK